METQNIEYKVKWKDEYLHYISGFANAGGGTLFIGLDDNGNIVGIENAEQLLVNLPNKAVQATGMSLFIFCARNNLFRAMESIIFVVGALCKN